MCLTFHLLTDVMILWGFPGGSDSKESGHNAGDTEDSGSVPGSGRSPGEGNGYLFQYSCPDNSMDRGSWWAMVHVFTKSNTIEQLTLFLEQMQSMKWMKFQKLRSHKVVLPVFLSGAPTRVLQPFKHLSSGQKRRKVLFFDQITKRCGPVLLSTHSPNRL